MNVSRPHAREARTGLVSPVMFVCVCPCLHSTAAECKCARSTLKGDVSESEGLMFGTVKGEFSMHSKETITLIAQGKRSLRFDEFTATASPACHERSTRLKETSTGTTRSTRQ